MRHVVDTSMVAHLWANKSQPDARNKQGNFYFDGDTIYSYGGHFPIARHVENGHGQRAILFTTKGYSSTTNGHKSDARNACLGQVVFSVPDVAPGFRGVTVKTIVHAENWKSYIERINEIALRAKNARSNRDYLLGILSGLIEQANAYAAFFGLRSRINATGDASEMMEQFAKERERIERAERARRIKEAKLLAKRLAESVEEWKAGADVYLPGHRLDTIYLRVQGDEIQSSRGARFPVSHAKLAFRLIASCHEDSRPWERNGHSIHLGGFNVDSIDADGNVKAGCHFVKWAEIERIARELGISVDVDANTKELVNA